MTPQTITEIDALLGNKPHSKKESRAWRRKSEWHMMFQEDEEDNDIGKNRFLLCCILNNLHVLSNIMLPVCAQIHFAQYIVSSMKKRKSFDCEKRSYIAHCQFFRLIISTEREAKTGWSDRSLQSIDREKTKKNSSDLTLVQWKVLKWKKPTSVLKWNFTAWTVLSLDIWRLFPSQLPVILYDV